MVALDIILALNRRVIPFRKNSITAEKIADPRGGNE